MLSVRIIKRTPAPHDQSNIVVLDDNTVHHNMTVFNTQIDEATQSVRCELYHENYGNDPNVSEVCFPDARKTKFKVNHKDIVNFKLFREMRARFIPVEQASIFVLSHNHSNSGLYISTGIHGFLLLRMISSVLKNSFVWNNEGSLSAIIIGILVAAQKNYSCLHVSRYMAKRPTGKPHPCLLLDLNTKTIHFLQMPSRKSGWPLIFGVKEFINTPDYYCREWESVFSTVDDKVKK